MPLPLVALKNFVPLLEAAELCAQRSLWAPALILVYSGIDAAGWINSKNPQTTKTDFKAWVDQFLLKEKPLPCSSADLYGARCGLLHNLASSSDMSSKGTAREIWYAWKPVPLAPLQKLASLPHVPNPVVMYGDDLLEGLALGLAAFESELTRDYSRDAENSAWQKQTQDKARQILVGIPWKPPEAKPQKKKEGPPARAHRSKGAPRGKRKKPKA